jgi:hypothetical protein
VTETGNGEPIAIAGELRAQFNENDLFALEYEENWWRLTFGLSGARHLLKTIYL